MCRKPRLYTRTQFGVIRLRGIKDACWLALQFLRCIAQHLASLAAQHLQAPTPGDDNAHRGVLQNGLKAPSQGLVLLLVMGTLLLQVLKHLHQCAHLATSARPVWRRPGRRGPERLRTLTQTRQRLRQPQHGQHDQRAQQRHAGGGQPPRLALRLLQRCQHRTRIRHSGHHPLRQRDASHAHDVTWQALCTASTRDGLCLGQPPGMGLGQTWLITHQGLGTGGIGVQQDRAIAREHHQARVAALGRCHGGGQQPLGLQPQRPSHHPQHSAITSQQGHGEQDTRLAGTPGDQLGHHGLAAHQRAAQGIALDGLHPSQRLKTAIAQVHAQLAVLARHLYRIKKWHCGQALLQQPLQ